MKYAKVSAIVAAVMLTVSVAPAWAAGTSGHPADSVVVPREDAGATPIAWEADTDLPQFVGAPATAKPLPPADVPQDPSLGPNPFNSVHNDSWMSDVYDIAGPLGRKPTVLTTTMAEARRNPASPTFDCSGDVFDSRGRLLLYCTGGGEASLVMVDPVSLEVLTYQHLPLPTSMDKAWASAYLYLDNQGRLVLPVVTEDARTVIRIVSTVGTDGAPAFQTVKEYDISPYIPAGDNMNGVMADWSGRIWFVVKNAARVGVLNPATGAVKTLALQGSITNTFAMTRQAAYVDTTARMYRVEAGSDGQPRMVWSAPYQNTGQQKPGQLSAGTGTSPTLLGGGRYVAIADNADQMHVVVYRTARTLPRGTSRIVCQVPVFQKGKSADENSLVGSGLSMIAYNAYGNDFDQIFDVEHQTYQAMGTEPGVARVDVKPNGTGCTKVWQNDKIAVTDEVAKLSTKTGLVYAIGRVWDTSVDVPNPKGLDVYYFTGIDFRTGKVAWQQMIGTGFGFDGFTNVLIGSTKTAYISQYGGLISIRDTQ